MTTFSLSVPALFAAASLALAAPVAAQNFDDIVAVQVLPGWTTRDGAQIAGLEFTLAPGWHTYWRSPGEMGIPPMFGFSGSSNLADVAITWPRPDVYIQDGYRSIVYHDRVVLPMELRPQNTNAGIELQGQAEIGVCADICVPVTIAFRADLPAGASNRNPAIVAALLDRPQKAARAEVGAVACDIAPVEGGISITAAIDMPSVGSREFAVFEHPDPTVWVDNGVTARKGGRLTAQATFYPAPGQALLVDRSALTITVLAENAAVEILGCPGG